MVTNRNIKHGGKGEHGAWPHRPTDVGKVERSIRSNRAIKYSIKAVSSHQTVQAC